VRRSRQQPLAPAQVADRVIMTMQPAMHSEITCPYCGHRKVEQMPTDACQFFYECQGCATVLRPKAGDCCVFCSYGSMPCPSIQVQHQGDRDPYCP
jgi:hypothetical protein